MVFVSLFFALSYAVIRTFKAPLGVSSVLFPEEHPTDGMTPPAPRVIKRLPKFDFDGVYSALRNIEGEKVLVERNLALAQAAAAGVSELSPDLRWRYALGDENMYSPSLEEAPPLPALGKRLEDVELARIKREVSHRIAVQLVGVQAVRRGAHVRLDFEKV